MDFQLVVLRGRSATTALKLGDGVTTAGRHDDCQLRIKSSEVSRRHCQFFEKNGMLLVKDLGSSNGTLLNGKKIEGQRVLEPGDELTIGPVKLRVEKLGQPAPAKVPPVTAAPKPGDTAVPDADRHPGRGLRRVRDRLRRRASSPPPRRRPSRSSPSAKPAAPAAGGGRQGRRVRTASTEEPIADDAIADFLLDLKLDDEE